MKGLFVFLLLALLGVSSCAYRPAIDDAGNITPRVSHPAMLEYGADTFDRYKREHSISCDPNMLGAVERVSKRLKKVVDMPDADWEFVVFRDNSANAFALPGGKVGINTGLFSLLETRDREGSDALLAAVIGHEISHVTVKHAEIRMYRGLAVGVIASALWYGLDQSGEDHPLQGAAVFALAAYLADSLPLSRWQEYESDKMGAVYMAKAGYDPRESIRLWRRLESYRSLRGQRKPGFLRTHPPDKKRISELREFMPVALKYFDGRLVR